MLKTISMKSKLNKTPLSLGIIVPVYNGSLNVDRSFRELKTKLNELVITKKIASAEIIFIDNGSTDETLEKLTQLIKDTVEITVLHTDTRGIGLALKIGLSRSKGDLTYFTAIDHPFNFEDLDGFFEQIDKYDLMFASKNNPKSVYQAPFKRKLASLILSNTVKALFNLPLTDTQGTFMIKKDALTKILPFSNSPGPFFQAQLAINAKRYGLRVGEIPITYRTKSNSSSFSLFRDGLLYVQEAIKERRCNQPNKSFPSA